MKMQASHYLSLPMSHQFLQAILANPDDDTPRLVYADWLDENGNPERAEFIRVQIELAKLSRWDPKRKALEQREDELFTRERNWREWTGSLPEFFNANWEQCAGRPEAWVTFRRGFPHEVKCSAKSWFDHAEEFYSAAPIEAVNGLESFDDWKPTQALRRLRRIELDDGFVNNRPVKAVSFLARRAKLLPLLRELSISFIEYYYQDMDRHSFIKSAQTNSCLRALAHSSLVEQLDRLELGWYGSATEGFHELCTSPVLRNLHHLRLSCSWISFAKADCVALAQLQAPLRSLSLQSLKLDDAAVSAIMGGPFLETLEELHLDNGPMPTLNCNRIGTAGMRALAEYDRFRQLRVLNLSGNNGGDEGAEAILHAPWLDQLEYLGLHSTKFDKGLKALTDPMKQRFRERLGNRVQLESEAWAQSPLEFLAAQLNIRAIIGRCVNPGKLGARTANVR
jgi:uncharacterized protein (TIGR02996 family)